MRVNYFPSFPSGAAMRCLAGLLLLVMAGCSTAPLTDVLDCVCPPRMIPSGTQTFGGVGGPEPAPPPSAVLQPPVLPATPVPAVGPP